jgi:hypothetical protein
MKNAERFPPELSRKRAKNVVVFQCLYSIYIYFRSEPYSSCQRKKESGDVGEYMQVAVSGERVEAAVFDEESLVAYLCMTEGGVYTLQCSLYNPITHHTGC